ncbi:MAG: hypothetical protein R3F34_12395 [Planctomycetota bacterium]
MRVGRDGRPARRAFLAARLAWSDGRYEEAAVHYRALADPFAARPLGRGDSAIRPVPGGNHESRRELERRALWSEALAAAQDRDATRAEELVRRARRLSNGDPDASARNVDVEERVRAALHGDD